MSEQRAGVAYGLAAFGWWGLVGWLVALIGIGCLFAGSVSRASHRLQRLS